MQTCLQIDWLICLRCCCFHSRGWTNNAIVSSAFFQFERRLLFLVVQRVFQHLYVFAPFFPPFLIDFRSFDAWPSPLFSLKEMLHNFRLANHISTRRQSYFFFKGCLGTSFQIAIELKVCYVYCQKWDICCCCFVFLLQFLIDI